MFYNREKELKILNDDYLLPISTYNFLFGRKNIGKTALINEYTKEKNFIYLFSCELNLNLMLKKYKETIDKYFHLSNDSFFSDFDDMFDYLSSIDIQSKLVIIIENTENILTINKNFIKEFYQIWNKSLKNKNIQLIMSSAVYPNTQLEKNTYKKASNIIKLNSMDFSILRDIIPEKSDDEYIKIYSTFGSNPYILNFYNIDLTFEENLKNNFFNFNSPLIKDVEILVKSLFNDVATYNSILLAISLGNKKIGDIASFLNLKSSYLTRYMIKLTELMIIEKKIPLSDNEENSKFGRYEIEDNYFNFWYSIIFPNINLINSNEIMSINHEIDININRLSNEALKKIILTNIDNCINYIPTKVGAWWNNKDIEIDCIAYNNKYITFIDCNYESKYKNNEFILKEKSKKFKSNLKIDYKIMTKVPI